MAPVPSDRALPSLLGLYRDQLHALTSKPPSAWTTEDHTLAMLAFHVTSEDTPLAEPDRPRKRFQA